MAFYFVTQHTNNRSLIVIYFLLRLKLYFWGYQILFKMVKHTEWLIYDANSQF